MLLTDTIIAVSSAPAGGGVRGIVRVSGKGAWELAGRVVRLPGNLVAGWYGGLAVPAVHESAGLAAVVLFKGPRSFTGEDVAEIELPDSAAVMGACVEGMLAAGRARLAGPGEFSARAFFNGKMDLTEAEGIAATINATTELELRAAASLREGHLYKEIARFADRIADILAMVEAGIDFSDEEGVSFKKIDADGLDQLRIGLQYLLTCAVRVDRADQLPSVVFIGEPNVGKSSLINVLCGGDRSITSPIAGTTRDILSATMSTASGNVRIIDVPGEEEPVDELRRKMMAAREAALLEADMVINVLANETEVVSGLSVSSRFGADTFTVQNKVDLLPAAEVRTFEFLPESAEFMTFRGEWQMVSARTGRNIELLREEIGKMVYRKPTISPHIPALNQRHRAILQKCRIAVSEAEELIDWELNVPLHPELLAADLRRALDLLGEITGTISPDDILGRIFSTFCIGK